MQEFELWKRSLSEDQQQDATGFFNVIKRCSELTLDSPCNSTVGDANHMASSAHDLYIIPFSKEYNSFLTKAAELLHKAGDLSSSPRYVACVNFVADSLHMHHFVFFLVTILYSLFPFTCRLKKFLHSRANSFLSNDYYDSDIAWMMLVSTLVYCFYLLKCCF